MQLVSDKQIKNLPVETKNGKVVGRIVSYELDLESQSIINYSVKPKQVVRGIFEGNLLINREQVVEISREKMVVEDTAINQKQANLVSVAN